MLEIKPGDKVVFENTLIENKAVMMRIIRKKTIDELFGSLRTTKGFVPIDVARRSAGKALGEKYEIGR